MALLVRLPRYVADNAPSTMLSGLAGPLAVSTNGLSSRAFPKARVEMPRETMVQPIFRAVANEEDLVRGHLKHCNDMAGGSMVWVRCSDIDVKKS